MMAYVCELASGTRIYLTNAEQQTIVTLASSGPGQQQQSSQSFQTGQWMDVPVAYQNASGVVIYLQTHQGDFYMQLQAGSISLMRTVPPVHTMESIPVYPASAPSGSMPSMEPMRPMQPMQPMRMGNMQMGMNPMEMRMGDMEMRMGKTAEPVDDRRFCSQCGASVKVGDRFCASCGHQLQ